MPTVGVIKPSTRPGRAEELVALLPPEITLLHAALNIASGTRAELEQALVDSEAAVAEMAAQGVDLIHPAGVYPLLLGYGGEERLVERWERRYGVPVFTNGMSQVNALRAFGARRLVAASYFSGAVNADFATYLREAGFEVLEAVGYEVDFRAAPVIPAAALEPFFSALMSRNPGCDALYLIGPAWRATLGMVDAMERTFGLPVIHHVPAQSWEMQRRLGFRRPVQGFGRLLAEMP